MKKSLNLDEADSLDMMEGLDKDFDTDYVVFPIWRKTLNAKTFVHVYFGTGRRLLYVLAFGLLLLAVVANFATVLNLRIAAIHTAGLHNHYRP